MRAKSGGMRRVAGVLFRLLVVCSVGGTAWSEEPAAGTLAAARMRVAVFDFEDRTEHVYHWWNGQPVGRGMADMLTTALMKSGRYRVMERQEMESLLQEEGLGLAGVTTPESAAKVGKMLGVQVAVIGSVTEFGYRKQSTGGALQEAGIGGALQRRGAAVGVGVRLVDTTSGEILKAESLRKEQTKTSASIDTDDLPYENEIDFDASLVGKATREVIDGVVALLDAQAGTAAVWEAKVVMMKDDLVIINAGSEGGVEVGDRFVVYRLGEELTDPETGESLGTSRMKVGEIEVADNNLGAKGKASACKIVAGSDFQKGDIVRQK